MPDIYTTLRVKKTTRDAVKAMADSKNVSVDDLVGSLTKATKDSVKQVLLNMPKERFYRLLELANVLCSMKLINEPRIEDAVNLAIDKFVEGMEKSLQSTATPQIGQVMRV